MSGTRAAQRGERVAAPAPAPAVDPVATVSRLVRGQPEQLSMLELTGWVADCERLAGWLAARAARGAQALDVRVKAAEAEEDRRIAAENAAAGLPPPPDLGYDHDWAVELLAVNGRLNPLQADRRMQLARALTGRLPVTMTELEAGRISYVHALVISETLDFLPDDLIGPLEARLATEARQVTPARLRRLARRLARAAEAEVAARAARLSEQPSPDSPPDPPRRTGEPNFDGGPERWLELVETGWEGSHVIRGQLPGDEAALLLAALDELGSRSGPDDHRTIDVRRADALAELSRYGLARPDRPLPPAPFRVHIVTPARVLAGDRGGEQAELPGRIPISPDRLALAACTAPWTVLLTDAATGALLDLRPASRAPTPALRRYVQFRDTTCRFPTCNRTALRCDVHHITERQHGGQTTRDNLIALCPRHHHAVHDAGWAIRGSPEADTLVFADPSGRSHPSSRQMLPGARSPELSARSPELSARSPAPSGAGPPLADTG
jgi:hypothetical protein